MPFFTADRDRSIGLFQVRADDLRQFKHRDLSLLEDRLQFVVGVNVSFVLAVLKFVFLDVGPEFLRDFRPRNRGCAHYCRELNVEAKK